MQSALPDLAQSATLSQGMLTPPTTGVSPLDGNWQITGNRELQQYPLISMAIHVNGKDVTAQGDMFETCLTSPHTGGGGSFGIRGEIAADGSFTLRSHPIPHHEAILLTITGKVPAVGSTSWSGSYSIIGAVTGKLGCSLDQGGAFVASRLAPLDGTFSGPLMLGYSGKPLKFSITANQGEFVTHERKVGPAYTYLPLTGTITVEGSPCFKHGTVDANLENTMQGDLAFLRFKMDDESELWVTAFYTNPDETGLVVRGATVKGGSCDKQAFTGTLSRQ